MYRFLFILITLVFPFLKLTGKDTHYSYTQLSINEGLSQANVRSILLDQKGNLWIGTKNGLNHYSEQKMENFFHQADNMHSLPDNEDMPSVPSAASVESTPYIPRKLQQVR